MIEQVIAELEKRIVVLRGQQEASGIVHGRLGPEFYWLGEAIDGLALAVVALKKQKGGGGA